MPAASAKPANHKHKPKSPATLVLHPRFHRVASHLSSFTADGRYVVMAGPGGTTLIDDQTGKHTTLSVPALCGLSYTVGGGWVLTSCSGFGNAPYQLYSIATGTWRALTSAGGMPVALGSDWIEYYGTTETGCTVHCAYQYTFADIATGQLRMLPDWTSGGITVPDLNSPGLAAKLCSPLRVPQGFPNDLTAAALAPSPLTFAGRFAAGIEWHLRSGLYELRLLVERCGSRLHQVLTSQVSSSPSNQFAVNRHAVIWENLRGGPVHGVFLPSLQRFTIPLPRIRGNTNFTLTGGSIFLTSRTMYLESGFGQVVGAASPIRPKH